MKKILMLLLITTLSLNADPYIMSKYLEYHVAIDDNIVTVDIPDKISREEQTRIFCIHAMKYVKDNELNTNKAVFIYFFTSNSKRKSNLYTVKILKEQCIRLR